MPEELRGAGVAAIFVVGIRALLSLSFADAEPLLDEMMTCVQIKMPAITRPLVIDGTENEDIEETETILLLRSEVLELHTGFSIIEMSKQWIELAREQITRGEEDEKIQRERIFNAQKLSAEQQGIEWNLSFEDWSKIVEASEVVMN